MSHSQYLNQIESTLDRFQEAHWNIHQMELYYHESDPFRFALNSFLRVLKEVPQILQMELQNKEEFTEWFRKRRVQTSNNPLISDLFKKRDIVVHRSMLKPLSKAYLGITEGRGLKWGMRLQLDPLEDSDILLVKYLRLCAKHDDLDVFGLLEEDEDSLPCVERGWRLEPFEENVLDLASHSWEQIGLLISDTVEWLGGDPINFNLNCIHGSSSVSMRMYKREWVKLLLDEINNGKNFIELMNILKDLRIGKQFLYVK